MNPVVELEHRIEELHRALRGHSGYRTIWWSAGQQWLTSEPDDDLEAEGLIYVATMLRPSREALSEAMLRHMPGVSSLEGCAAAPAATLVEGERADARSPAATLLPALA